MDLGRAFAKSIYFQDFFVPKSDFWEALELGKTLNPVSGRFRDGFGNGFGKTGALKVEKKGIL